MNKDARSAASVQVDPIDSQTSVAATSIAATASTFKYHVEIRQILVCPPNHAKCRDAAGFRFVRADLTHPANALPPAKINPARTVNTRPITSCCTAFALSLFDSVSNLRSHARKLQKSSPQVLKAIGDHYAKVVITPQCGETTVPDARGHFDFFEYADFDLIKSVIESGVL